MKIIYTIILTYILVVSCAIASYAAMNDEVASDPDTVINTIVEERLKAKQEYKEYVHTQEIKKKEAAKAKALAQAKAHKEVAEKQKDDSKNNDVLIGSILIAIAIILTAYLHISSKARKAS